MNHFYSNYNCTHSDTNASMSDKVSSKKKKKSTKGKNGGGGGGGAAVKLSTDPQSVAARERRHRISERFKTLQSMVPGGAKLDTVSMLDEAIHYVKFLKTQIWLHETLISRSSNSVSVSVDDRCNDLFQQQQQPQLDELMYCCHESVERSDQCSVDDVASVFVAGDSSWGCDMRRAYG